MNRWHQITLQNRTGGAELGPGIRRFGVRFVTETESRAPLRSAQGQQMLQHNGFLRALTPRLMGLFPALQASGALLYAARCEDCFALFPGSSVVEQPAVN